VTKKQQHICQRKELVNLIWYNTVRTCFKNSLYIVLNTSFLSKLYFRVHRNRVHREKGTVGCV